MSSHTGKNVLPHLRYVIRSHADGALSGRAEQTAVSSAAEIPDSRSATEPKLGGGNESPPTLSKTDAIAGAADNSNAPNATGEGLGDFRLMNLA